MDDFSHLEAQMGQDVHELHNFLWTPGWEGDEDRLQKSLQQQAGELDAFLGAEGTLEDNTKALTKDWGRNRSGEMLFELLDHTYKLTAATELLREGEFAKAAAQANQAAESVSIGVCANAGCFPLVEQWEGGEITFGTYVGELAKVLGEKGLAPSGRIGTQPTRRSCRRWERGPPSRGRCGSRWLGCSCARLWMPRPRSPTGPCQGSSFGSHAACDREYRYTRLRSCASLCQASCATLDTFSWGSRTWIARSPSTATCWASRW